MHLQEINRQHTLNTVRRLLFIPTFFLRTFFLRMVFILLHPSPALQEPVRILYHYEVNSIWNKLLFSIENCSVCDISINNAVRFTVNFEGRTILAPRSPPPHSKLYHPTTSDRHRWCARASIGRASSQGNSSAQLKAPSHSLIQITVATLRTWILGPCYKACTTYWITKPTENRNHTARSHVILGLQPSDHR